MWMEQIVLKKGILQTIYIYHIHKSELYHVTRKKMKYGTFKQGNKNHLIFRNMHIKIQFLTITKMCNKLQSGMLSSMRTVTII